MNLDQIGWLFRLIERGTHCFTERSELAQSFGSSQYRAIADDTLKDEDNAAWVIKLKPSLRKAWIERISWIRLVDRLAEAEFVCQSKSAHLTDAFQNDEIDPSDHSGTSSSQFAVFYYAWHRLLSRSESPDQAGRPLLKYAKEYGIFQSMIATWFTDLEQRPRTEVEARAITAWDRYLDAILTYHAEAATVEAMVATIEDYELMLDRLAGSFFQVLPGLEAHQFSLARTFGKLDQFYNNLRDQLEDARQGICYIPGELLNRFGIDRSAILDGTAARDPAYQQMMRAWLAESLPRLWSDARGFLTAQDLSLDWMMLRSWSLHRYQRIERLLRSCNFDYTKFPDRYWSEVQQDLEAWRQSGHLPQPETMPVRSRLVPQAAII